MRSQPARFRVASLAAAAVTVALTFGAASARADTVCVDPSGGCAYTTIQAAVAAANASSTPSWVIDVHGGTYTLASPITISKSMTLAGPYAGVSPNSPAVPLDPNPARSGSAEATIAVAGATQALRIAAPDVTVDGFRFTNTGAAAADVQTQLIGAGESFGGAAPGVRIVNDVFDGISRMAVYFNGTNAMQGATVDDNRVVNPTRPASGCAGTVAPSNCGHQLFNLWKTNDLSFQGNVVFAPAGNGDRVRVFNTTGTDGVIVADNTVRNACTYTCFAFGPIATGVVVSDNDVVIDVGNAVLLQPTWAGGSVVVSGNTFTATGDVAMTIDNAAADLSDVSVTDNALTAGGIRNASAQVLNAAGNWWGSAAGPAPMTNVLAAPWCLDASCSALSGGARLTSLALSAGALSPAFDPAVTSYRAVVGSGVTSVTVFATADPGASVVVSGGAALGVGSNPVAVTVISAGGLTQKTYAIDVVRPEPPAPEPDPTPPPAPVEQFSAATEAPAPAPAPAPTPTEVREAQTHAADDLGAPVKRDTSVDLGAALAFTPAPKAADVTPDTPKVSGNVATLDRSGIGDATPQKLMAVSCPTTECTATFTLTLTYRDSKGKLKTVTLKDVSVDVAQGGTGVLELGLPKEARDALLGGGNVKLKVGMSIDSPSGPVGSDSKTLTLKATKKKAKKG